jgi:hypothetical protein
VVLGVACSIDSTVSVFTHSFLKEVCFAVEGNNIHPWEGVGNIVDSRLFQFAKEAIGTESNGVQFTHIRIATKLLDVRGTTFVVMSSHGHDHRKRLPTVPT